MKILRNAEQDHALIPRIPSRFQPSPIFTIFVGWESCHRNSQPKISYYVIARRTHALGLLSIPLSSSYIGCNVSISKPAIYPQYALLANACMRVISCSARLCVVYVNVDVERYPFTVEFNCWLKREESQEKIDAWVCVSAWWCSNSNGHHWLRWWKLHFHSNCAK